MDYFESLDDPRVDRGKRHKLVDLIAIAISAVICGADSWVYVEMFGKSKEEWFRTFLELPHGIPSHDTFGDVFSRLDAEQFQECFMGWTQAVADLLPGEVVAIDGKTVRRSHDGAAGRRAIHLVSAWASANTLTLGQVKTEEKSNEITAIPRLLAMLELTGCIVYHRCHGVPGHGVPEGDRPGDSGPGGGLCAGGEGEPGPTARGCEGPVRGRRRVCLPRVTPRIRHYSGQGTWPGGTAGVLGD